MNAMPENYLNDIGGELDSLSPTPAEKAASEQALRDLANLDQVDLQQILRDLNASDAELTRIHLRNSKNLLD